MRFLVKISFERFLFFFLSLFFTRQITKMGLSNLRNSVVSFEKEILLVHFDLRLR